MPHDQVKFCSIGYGGNSMEYGGGCHGSWYLHTPEEIAQHYRAGLSEGVLCLDKRPALDVNTTYAFASPMVDVELDEGAVDELKLSAFAEEVMLPALKMGGYGAVIQAHELSKEIGVVPGPLDKVDVGYYCRWWVERGAVLYLYDGEQFVRVELPVLA